MISELLQEMNLFVASSIALLRTILLYLLMLRKEPRQVGQVLISSPENGRDEPFKAVISPLLFAS